MSSASALCPQNTTPLAISRSSSDSDMWGSVQRSAAMTPRYASAAEFIICRISADSSERHWRIVLMAICCRCRARFATNRIRETIMPRRCLLTLVALVPSLASAQAATPVLHSAAYQIAAAVTPLPPEMRDGATVLGYTALGKPLVTLREGKNDMICLAPDPSATAYHAACYHKAMEPFMARGRALRAQGVTGGRVDTVRFAEVKSGKLAVPKQPSMLYQIFGGTFDSVTAKATGGQSLFVTYIPFATPQTTGISSTPSDRSPWIMFPGTPKAHIMYAGTKM